MKPDLLMRLSLTLFSLTSEVRVSSFNKEFLLRSITLCSREGTVQFCTFEEDCTGKRKKRRVIERDYSQSWSLSFSPLLSRSVRNSSSDSIQNLYFVVLSGSSGISFYFFSSQKERKMVLFFERDSFTISFLCREKMTFFSMVFVNKEIKCLL
jgi:hypothetical protein